MTGLEVPVRAVLLLAAAGLLAGSVACEAPRLTFPDVSPVALRGAPGDSAGPLIIVDGKLLLRGASLGQLGMNDIERVEVIKGVAATTLYGEPCRAIVINLKHAGHSLRSPVR